jgi:hypothetical protein
MLEWAIANHLLEVRKQLEVVRLQAQKICKTTCLSRVHVLADRCPAIVCIAAPLP